MINVADFDLKFLVDLCVIVIVTTPALYMYAMFLPFSTFILIISGTLDTTVKLLLASVLLDNGDIISNGSSYVIFDMFSRVYVVRGSLVFTAGV